MMTAVSARSAVTTTATASVMTTSRGEEDSSCSATIRTTTTPARQRLRDKIRERHCRSAARSVHGEGSIGSRTQSALHELRQRTVSVIPGEIQLGGKKRRKKKTLAQHLENEPGPPQPADNVRGGHTVTKSKRPGGDASTVTTLTRATTGTLSPQQLPRRRPSRPRRSDQPDDPVMRRPRKSVVQQQQKQLQLQLQKQPEQQPEQQPQVPESRSPPEEKPSPSDDVSPPVLVETNFDESRIVEPLAQLLLPTFTDPPPAGFSTPNRGEPTPNRRGPSELTHNRREQEEGEENIVYNTPQQQQQQQQQNVTNASLDWSHAGSLCTHNPNLPLQAPPPDESVNLSAISKELLFLADPPGEFAKQVGAPLQLEPEGAEITDPTVRQEDEDDELLLDPILEPVLEPVKEVDSGAQTDETEDESIIVETTTAEEDLPPTPKSQTRRRRRSRSKSRAQEEEISPSVHASGDRIEVCLLLPEPCQDTSTLVMDATSACTSIPTRKKKNKSSTTTSTTNDDDDDHFLLNYNILKDLTDTAKEDLPFFAQYFSEEVQELQEDFRALGDDITKTAKEMKQRSGVVMGCLRS